VRIATWNVNSLKARLEKVQWWLDRAKPDVLFMQETKLADDDVPADVFRAAGYELAHHGEGRWNGVAIASRVGIADVVTNFGAPLRPDPTPDVHDDQPLAEAADPATPLVIGGDFNVAPADEDVWDPAACHGGTHVSEPERDAFRGLCAWGLTDAYRRLRKEPGRYTWWDYRAGNFHKNFGMRIDHLLVTDAVAKRLVAAEIDREARKGKPIPSDHTPLVIDLDASGTAFDPGWSGAEFRIARRKAKT
jgi:exodeoxyribonuclease-3